MLAYAYYIVKYPKNGDFQGSMRVVIKKRAYGPAVAEEKTKIFGISYSREPL